MKKVIIDKKSLLIAIEQLVNKPTTVDMQGMVNIFTGLSEVLAKSFGEPVQLTTVYSERTPVVPFNFPEFTDEERESERLQFVEFLKLQPYVLNVGYDSDKKQFLLKEDQVAWEAWIYRALLQKTVPNKPKNKHFDGTLCSTDIRIDTFHVSIGDTQFLKKQDIGVRVTHLPTGVCVESKSERTQHKNRERAFRLLEDYLRHFSTAPQTCSKETLERFNTYFLTTPNGEKVHETVMSFWHSEQQRFLIGEIQEVFEQWLKDNKQ